jgi:hypothetical protein
MIANLGMECYPEISRIRSSSTNRSVAKWDILYMLRWKCQVLSTAHREWRSFLRAVEDMTSQLLHSCVLQIYCCHYLAKVVFYGAITQQRLLYSYLCLGRSLAVALHVTISIYISAVSCFMKMFCISYVIRPNRSLCSGDWSWNCIGNVGTFYFTYIRNHAVTYPRTKCIQKFLDLQAFSIFELTDQGIEFLRRFLRRRQRPSGQIKRLLLSYVVKVLKWKTWGKGGRYLHLWRWHLRQFSIPLYD